MLDFSLLSSFLVGIPKNPDAKYLIYTNSLVANLDVQSVYFLCQELDPFRSHDQLYVTAYILLSAEPSYLAATCLFLLGID